MAIKKVEITVGKVRVYFSREGYPVTFFDCDLECAVALHEAINKAFPEIVSAYREQLDAIIVSEREKASDLKAIIDKKEEELQQAESQLSQPCRLVKARFNWKKRGAS